MGIFDIAAQGLNAAVNYGMNLDLMHNQHSMSKETMKWQHEYNEKSANKADERQRKQYFDLYSPEAKKQQLKEAGLSPGLMYGQQGGVGGGGAATGAQGGGTGLPGTSVPYGNYLDITQATLAAAQAEALKAQANKDNADAETTRGDNNRGAAEIKGLEKKTDEIDANIKKLQGETKNQEAQAALAENESLLIQAKTTAETLANQWTEENWETNATLLRQQVALMNENIKIAQNEGRIKKTEADYAKDEHQAMLRLTATDLLLKQQEFGINRYQAGLLIKQIQEAASRIEKTKSETVNEDELYRRFKEQLEQENEIARKNRNNQTWNNILHTLGTIVTTAAFFGKSGMQVRKPQFTKPGTHTTK